LRRCAASTHVADVVVRAGRRPGPARGPFGGRPGRARNQGVPGTGLGLAISRTVIERHGGTITVTDHGDKRGTTFVLRLPAYCA
jgi:hypothetical protein